MRLSNEEIQRLIEIFKPIPQILVVYLFGSRAKGTDEPRSDFDFAILTKRILGLDERASLIGEITSALETDEVDVVFLSSIHSVPLKFRIISEGQILYCIDEKERVKFEEGVISEYQLLRPFLMMYDKHFVEEVKKVYGHRQGKSH